MLRVLLIALLFFLVCLFALSRDDKSGKASTSIFPVLRGFSCIKPWKLNRFGKNVLNKLVKSSDENSCLGEATLLSDHLACQKMMGENVDPRLLKLLKKFAGKKERHIPSLSKHKREEFRCSGESGEHTRPAKTALINAASGLYPSDPKDYLPLKLRKEVWDEELGGGYCKLFSLEDQSLTAQGITLDGTSRRIQQYECDGIEESTAMIAVSSDVDDAMVSLGIGPQPMWLQDTVEAMESSSFPEKSDATFRERIGVVHNFLSSNMFKVNAVPRALHQGYVMSFCDIYYAEALIFRDRTSFENDSSSVQKLTINVGSGVGPLEHNPLLSSGWSGSGGVDRVHQLMLGTVDLAVTDMEVRDSQTAIGIAFYLAKQVEIEPTSDLYAFALKGIAPFGRDSALGGTDFSIDQEVQSSRRSLGRVISSCGKVRAYHLVANVDEGFRRRRRSSLHNISGRIGRVQEFISSKIADLTEDEIMESNRQNNRWTLILAGASLLTSIVTTVGISAAFSHWNLLLRVAVEVLDLVLGALPGYALVTDSLGYGNAHITPLFVGTDSIPGYVQEQLSFTGPDEKVLVYPFHVAQCGAIGIWRSIDRTIYYRIHIAGILIGGVVILADVLCYLQKKRRRRRERRDD